MHRKAQIPYGQQNWKELQKPETVWMIHLFVLHAFSTVGGALQVLGRGWGCPQRAVSTGALESDLASAPCGSISLKRGL